MELVRDECNGGIPRTWYFEHHCFRGAFLFLDLFFKPVASSYDSLPGMFNPRFLGVKIE